MLVITGFFVLSKMRGEQPSVYPIPEVISGRRRRVDSGRSGQHSVPGLDAAKSGVTGDVPFQRGRFLRWPKSLVLVDVESVSGEVTLTEGLEDRFLFDNVATG
jgi:hypothetical protein